MDSIDPNTLSLLMGVLFGISELLGMIPSIRANGVFQAVYFALKRLAGKGQRGKRHRGSSDT